MEEIKAKGAVTAARSMQGREVPAGACCSPHSMQTMCVTALASSLWSSASSWQCRQTYGLLQQDPINWHLQSSKHHFVSFTAIATGCRCIVGILQVVQKWHLSVDNNSLGQNDLTNDRLHHSKLSYVLTMTGSKALACIWKTPNK